MSAVNTQLFVRYDSDLASEARELHPTMVTSVDGDRLTIRPEASLSVAPGDSVQVYFELKRVFMQQAATVMAEAELTSDADDESSEAEVSELPLIGLQLLGDPVSAESRQTYRVSTVISDRTVQVEGDERCSLSDVSLTGFGMVSELKLKFAQVVGVRLPHEIDLFEGTASVQSIKELGDGRFRYGFNGIDTPGETLMRGLQRMTLDMRREQLRRQSRAS